LVFGVAAAAAARPARAIAPLPDPPQAVAVLDGGTVWFDEGPVFLVRSGGRKARLGSALRVVGSQSSVASSGRDVAVTGGGEEAPFLAGSPPGPLERVAQPPLRPRAGCKGWEAGGVFALAGDELVAAGECHWNNRYSARPLFVTRLGSAGARRGSRWGRWRVLRWLPPAYDPLLAAEGSVLAVAVPVGDSSRMRVSLIDLAGRSTAANFVLPGGDLSFASPSRLVLSVPQLPFTPPAGEVASERNAPFRSTLYSTGGRRLEDLGASWGPPLVSHMHLVIAEDPGPTLSVRELTDGATRQVIAFADPARTLDAVSFRWPALAVVQSTSAPLAPDQVGCWTGSYGAPEKPVLRLFDLAREEPFIPAPALVEVRPTRPLTDCGPPPP
jgi:hypothetical protein